MDDIAEILLSEVQFNVLDLIQLGMLDTALDSSDVGSRLHFLVAAIRHSATSRLQVPHDFL